ncbi:MAG: M14 family zinc carboxypeptidase [Thermoanaerobaculia bacterium]
MKPLRSLRLAPAAVLLAALFALATPLTAEGFAGSGPWMVRAWFGDDGMIREVASWGDHLQVDRNKGFLRVLVDAGQLARLERLGFFVEVDEEATALVRLAESAQADWDRPDTIPGFPCYRTVEETFASAQALATAHPTLATIVDIGDSWDKVTGGGPAGYDLLVLKLTNSAVVGPKPVLLVSAAIHAREYTTAESALRFAEWILGAYGTDADATWVLDQHEIHIVLQTNPDGRKTAEASSSWRKNRNNGDGCASTYGVDLNRNFSFYWGAWGGSSGVACDETFRGSAAASEPETQAVQAYMATVFPDQRPDDLTTPAADTATGLYVDLHSYANEILSAWGQTTSAICDGVPPNSPPNCAQILRLGRKWAYLSGFDPRVGSLYPVDGSTKDYSYGHLGVPGYTWEMGTAFFESCSAFTSAVLPDALAMLKYAMRVPRTPYQTPAGPDALSVTAPAQPVAPGDPAVITATLDDTRYLDPDGAEPTQPIAAAELYLDTPPWAGGTPVAMTPVDGTFNATVEAATATLDTTGFASGRHLLYVRGRDNANNWGAFSAAFLTVLDPATAPFLEGTVTEAGSGAPLAATIAVGPYATSSVAGTGAYSLQVPAGTYDVTATAPAHAPATASGVVLGTLQTVIRNFVLAPYVAVLNDTVESGNLGWTAQAPWAITTLQAHSPTHSWTDSPAGSYGNNVNSSLTSSAIDLAQALGVELSFWQRYATEAGYDFCHVEVSADNGTTWTEIATFDGTNTTWTKQTYVVAALIGATQARVRFRLTTDTNTVADGWYVDDIELRAAFPPPTGLFADGFESGDLTLWSASVP